MSDHVSPIGLYLTIFFALMILTGVTVAAAFLDLGQLNFSVAMPIRREIEPILGFKASLVVWYFMHVKYQSHLTKLTLATGLFFLTILLGMSLIDYVSRGPNFQQQLPVTTPAAVFQTPEAH